METSVIWLLYFSYTFIFKQAVEGCAFCNAFELIKKFTKNLRLSDDNVLE